MAQAKYSIQIPTQDNLGQPLKDLSAAVHTYLFRNFGVEGSWKDTGQIGYWRDDDPEPYETLVTIQEESPEMDSAVKEAGKFVAEIANQWGIHVHKSSSNGPASWIVNNSSFRPDEGADPSVLLEPVPPVPNDPLPPDGGALGTL